MVFDIPVYSFFLKDLAGYRAETWAFTDPRKRQGNSDADSQNLILRQT